MKSIFCIFIFISLSFSAVGQFVTVGPTLHYYFSKPKPQITVGVEGTFHFAANNFGLQGIVLGAEAGKGIRSLYGELQNTHLITSYTSTGVAAGIFRKWENEQEPLTGFQVTAWGSTIFAGADFRFRIGKDYSTAAVGTFAKMPLFINRDDWP